MYTLHNYSVSIRGTLLLDPPCLRTDVDGDQGRVGTPTYRRDPVTTVEGLGRVNVGVTLGTVSLVVQKVGKSRR